jgi:formylglycine-generating enzyme required for sulfatase activity
LNSTGARAKVGDMRARRCLAVACALLACAAAACTLLNPLGYLGPGDGGDAAATDSGQQDSLLDHRANDAGIPDSEEGSTSADSSTGNCPDGSVSAEKTFCIDGQEVTNGPYKTFLDNTEGGVIDAPPECVWKKNLHSSQTLALGMNEPVGGVDWCDAFLYCVSVNERLCGALGDGGPVLYSERTDSAVDEWTYACSKAGTRQYPYGDAYVPSACNGLDYDASGPLGEMKAGKDCSGGFADLLNMSGNVAEWENSCQGAASSDDSCGVRGGSYTSPQSGLDCASPDNYARNTTSKFIGFRCCADRSK